MALSADGSLVVAGCGDGHLYAYGRTGKLLWKHRAAAPVEGASVCADGSLVVAYSAEGALTALDGGGRKLWGESVSGGRHGRMALSADGARVATQTAPPGTVIFDREGAHVWAKPGPGNLRSLAMSADGRLIVGVLDPPALVAFDGEGRELWRHGLKGSGARATLSRDGSLIAVLAGDFSTVPTGGKLEVWSPAGKRLWVAAAGSRVSSFSLSADGSLVVAGSLDRNIYAFNASGELLWKFKAGDWILFTEVAAGASLVVAGTGPEEEAIYGFDRDGRLQLRHAARGVIRSLATSEDGARIVVGAGDRGLFVLDAWER